MVSNLGVRRPLHVALLVALGAAVAICFLIVAIRVQQYVFRLRVERLQNDIRSLQCRKTGLAETQATLRHWNATYGHDGSCDQSKCSSEIMIGDFAYAHAEFFSNHQRLFRAYGILGGRPAMVRAGVSFENGVVYSKSYATYIEVFPRESVALGFTSYGYSLIGETATMESLPPRYGRYPAESRHPAYKVGWPDGCEICIMIYAHFTPAASETDVARLGNLDLSCLTRWFYPCRLKADIMPTAWQDVQEDEPARSSN